VLSSSLIRKFDQSWRPCQALGQAQFQILKAPFAARLPGKNRLWLAFADAHFSRARSAMDDVHDQAQALWRDMVGDL